MTREPSNAREMIDSTRPTAPAAPRWSRSRRPLAYPTVVALTYVAMLLDATGVSPFAAVRSLVVVAAVTLAISAAIGWMLNDRERAGAIALLLVLATLMGMNRLALLTLVVGIVLVGCDWGLAHRRRSLIPWKGVSRGLATFATIWLLAVLLRAVQDGRAVQVARDIVEEGPARGLADPIPPATGPLPDIYLVLLDGYPRSDKLSTKFGIDDSVFVRKLKDDGFTVAGKSRSNYLGTHLTLASMLNAQHLGDLFEHEPPGGEWHGTINDASALATFRARGYETVSISPGFEITALRRVDRFIETGELNEFERVLFRTTLLQGLLDSFDPTLLGRDYAHRVVASFDAATALAREGGNPRLVFVHIGGPHAPLVLGANGEPAIEAPGGANIFDDHLEVARIGIAAYTRALATEVEYVDARVVQLVGAIDANGRPSVVVVFSDHGSGAYFDNSNPLASTNDVDLRSANLLAVRGLDAVTDRMTLINLLPAIAQQYLGIEYQPSAEETRIYLNGYQQYQTFQRPD